MAHPISRKKLQRLLHRDVVHKVFKEKECFLLSCTAQRKKIDHNGSSHPDSIYSKIMYAWYKISFLSL